MGGAAVTALERAREAVQDATGLSARQAGDAVRATLAAIREPSAATLAAGEAHDEGGWGAPASAEVHWPAMIDHILNGGE